MFEKIKTKLEQERLEIEAQIQADQWTDKERSDSEEFAQMEGTHEVFFLWQKRLLKRLSKIDFLLSKIQNEDFGQCQDCLEKIEEPRLLVSEDCQLCTECQAAREQDEIRLKKMFKRVG